MAFANDIADDMETFDGIEQITLAIQNHPDDSGKVYGVNALQRPLSKREMSGGIIGIEPSDTVFHLQANTLDDVKPQQRDVIEQEDGTRWTILATSRETLGTRWRCICRLQVS